jgi:transcriptional regulator with XRE-family HTH domain
MQARTGEQLVAGKEGLMDLGDELKAVRQAGGLSLNAVAAPAKISAAYLQKLEAGVVKNPSPRVLHRLAEVLGVSYVMLMKRAGYFMPTREQTAIRSQERRAEQVLFGEALTEEERRAVKAFVAYLKEQRKQP